MSHNCRIKNFNQDIGRILLFATAEKWNNARTEPWFDQRSIQQQPRLIVRQDSTLLSLVQIPALFCTLEGLSGMNNAGDLPESFFGKPSNFLWSTLMPCQTELNIALLKNAEFRTTSPSLLLFRSNFSQDIYALKRLWNTPRSLVQFNSQPTLSGLPSKRINVL